MSSAGSATLPILLPPHSTASVHQHLQMVIQREPKAAPPCARAATVLLPHHQKGKAGLGILDGCCSGRQFWATRVSQKTTVPFIACRYGKMRRCFSNVSSCLSCSYAVVQASPLVPSRRQGFDPVSWQCLQTKWGHLTG